MHEQLPYRKLVTRKKVHNSTDKYLLEGENKKTKIK